MTNIGRDFRMDFVCIEKNHSMHEFYANINILLLYKYTLYYEKKLEISILFQIWCHLK